MTHQVNSNMNSIPGDWVNDILDYVTRVRHIESARQVNREFAHALRPRVSLTSDILRNEWNSIHSSGRFGFILTGDVYYSPRGRVEEEYSPLGKCYVLGVLDEYANLYYKAMYEGRRVNGSALDAVDIYGYFVQDSKKENRYGLNRDNSFGLHNIAEAVRFVPDHISWLKILLERCAVFELDQEEAHRIVLQDFDYMTELVDMTEFYRALGYDTLQEVRSAIK